MTLETEIKDLQCEFERDREDYLESIRKQGRQISLLQAILERLQPCIRRDSNYANLDKIKKQAWYVSPTALLYQSKLVKVYLYLVMLCQNRI